MAPRMVPISVAIKAAAKPTVMETWAPLITFERTSRPNWSPPKGSVSDFSVTVLLNLAARSAHSW